MYNIISMDIQKVFNPLTGRMINASGATAKSVKQKQQKVSVLEAVIKRKLTKKPEPAPKPAPKPKRTYITKKKKEEASKVLQGAVKRTLAKKPEPPKPEPKPKRTYITKKKKEEASKVLQGAVKRTLAKKPEPPKPAPKKFGFEDLDEGVKDMISGYVKKNKSYFNEDGRDVSNFRQGFLRPNEYISYVNQVLEDTDVSHKVRLKLRRDAIKNIKGGDNLVEVYDYNRRMKAFIKKAYNKKDGENLIISDLGTKSLFIVPDYSNDFYYDMSGGYGGGGYEVLDDGKYISEEDAYQRLENEDGYENGSGLKIELFDNPNLIAKLEREKYGGSEWIIPKYDEYVLSQKEYEVMVGKWFADSSLKKNERKVVPSIPTQDSDDDSS